MTTITIDRAVVEQALDALEHMADEYGFTNKANRIERWKSVAALREALNAPQPEPVLNVLWEYAGRKDLSDDDQSLLKHLADIIRARGEV
jgi:hypothetical protein